VERAEAVKRLAKAAADAYFQYDMEVASCRRHEFLAELIEQVAMEALADVSMELANARLKLADIAIREAGLDV
jgi:hypothetical protein